MLSSSVVSDSLQPYGPEPPRLLCPRSSPGKNIGVGSQVLLRRLLPPQGSNPSLLLSPALQADSLPLSNQRSPELPLWASNSTLWYILSRNKDTRPLKTLYMNVHGSVFHVSPKVWIILMSIHRWMNKSGITIQWNIAQPKKKKKRNEMLIHAITHVNLTNVMLSERTQARKVP